MRIWVLLLIFLAGCATGLKRDAHCLAVLTPEFLDAQKELSSLESSWRASLRNYSTQVNFPLTVHIGSSDSRHEPWPAVPGSPPQSLDTSGANAEQAGEAYRKLAAAKRRHHALFEWYGKVYERVLTRLEEDRILTEVFLTLMTSPALVFYPIIRWNIRSVYWEGADPDDESDPITGFCSERLSSNKVAAQD